jgi:hypothetical protein
MNINPECASTPVWYQGTVKWATLAPAQRLWLAVAAHEYDGVGCKLTMFRDAGFLMPDTHLYDEIADMVQLAGSRDITGKGLYTTVQALVDHGSLSTLDADDIGL